MVSSRTALYDGSRYTIYVGSDENNLIMHFKDGDQEPLATVRNKISARIWSYLASIGIKNHFLKTLNVKEQLIKAVDVSQVFVRLHNISQPEMSRRLGVESGTIFTYPLIEWHLKSNTLGNPLISRDHIEYFGWLNRIQTKEVYKVATRVNDVLRALFHSTNFLLASIEMTFGLEQSSTIILVGEFSPITIQFWEEEKAQVADYKDIFPYMQLNIPKM